VFPGAVIAITHKIALLFQTKGNNSVSVIETNNHGLLYSVRYSFSPWRKYANIFLIMKENSLNLYVHLCVC